MFFRKMFAFIKRDFLISRSYRSVFIFNGVGIAVSVLTFYFISNLFGSTMNPYIIKYGTTYFPFVIVGMAFSTYLHTAVSSLSDKLRTEQVTGTLEMLLITPVRMRELIIGMSLWNFIFASLRVFVYILIGVYFLKLDVSKANIPGAIIVLLLTIICFTSLGIIAASVTILFKRDMLISWFVGRFSSFFGGTYFPIDILPMSLRFISYLLPVTYSLRSIRNTILRGSTLLEIKNDLLVLIIYSLILVPFSILIFKIVLKRAKVKGTLAHY